MTGSCEYGNEPSGYATVKLSQCVPRRLEAQRHSFLTSVIDGVRGEPLARYEFDTKLDGVQSRRHKLVATARDLNRDHWDIPTSQENT